MSLQEIATALGPVFSFLSPKDPVTGAAWEQYALALRDVNPGDLDDAIDDLRKTHAFRNAPLPADILRRCEDAKRKRIALVPPEPVTTVTVDPNEGEWKTFAPTSGPLKGLSLKFHVLPDEHPALPRYSCVRCQDTSWEEVPRDNPGQPVMRRCSCWQSNPVIARQRSERAERQRSR